MLLLYFILSFSWATPSKHALIIAVSDYQNPSITPLASDTDARILVDTLTGLGVPPEHILTLGKEQATRAGILEKWKALNLRLKAGDFVHIHYSGHGSQVPDENGDEWEDGLDEVWVSYDARYKNLKLDPSSVVLDDEVEILQKETRRIIGPGGQLFMTMDACHNATATRAVEDAVVTRHLKTEYPAPNLFGKKAEEVPDDDSLAPLISISASRDTQEAAEVRIDQVSMGGLTYALKELLPQVKPNTSYEDIFQDVVLILQRHAPAQTPTLAGSRSSVFFKNDFVYQEPYFTVKKVLGTSVEINAGRHLGLNEGAVVTFYPKGTRKAEGEPLAQGTVVKPGVSTTKITLQTGMTNIDYKNPGQYWAFIKHKSFKAGGTHVFLENLGVAERTSFEALVETMPLIHIQETKEGAALSVSFLNGGWYVRDLRLPAQEPAPVSIEEVAPIIQSISTRQFLMDLMAQYQNKEVFQVEMLKKDGTPWPINDAGGISLMPNDAFRFKLTNNSSKTLKVTILNVDDSIGRIQQVLPVKEELTSAIGLPPGEHFILPAQQDEPFYIFQDSKGMEKALFVAHPDEAVDFSPLNTDGKVDITDRPKTRGVLDPLISMPVTRGFGRKKKEPVFRGYTNVVIMHVDMEVP